MRISTYRGIAAICILIGIVLILFTPFISVPIINIGLSGSSIFSFSAWMIVPIICGVLMIAVCLVAENPIFGIAMLAIGSFVPLITEEIVKNQCTDNIFGMLGTTNITLTGVLSNAVATLLSPGLGVILFIVLGLLAAVLFYLDQMPAKVVRNRSVGVGKHEDADW